MQVTMRMWIIELLDGLEIMGRCASEEKVYIQSVDTIPIVLNWVHFSH